MDTNQLTPMAYEIIWLANDASHFLKSELGAACSDFHKEDDYLIGILTYIKEIEAAPIDYLDSWNIAEQTDIRKFKQKIKALRNHIEKSIATPLEKRGTPEWQD